MRLNKLLLVAFLGLVCLQFKAQICFGTAKNYSVIGDPIKVISADFNGDGKQDLATQYGGTSSGGGGGTGTTADEGGGGRARRLTPARMRRLHGCSSSQDFFSPPHQGDDACLLPVDGY